MEGRTRLADLSMECLWDVRYTFRKLGRDPGFAAISILILALAVGANIAVFSVVNTLLLRPLPFPNSNELVWMAPPPQKCGFSCSTYSADAYDELRAESRSYQDITGYEAFTSADNLRLTGHGEHNRLPASRSSAISFKLSACAPRWDVCSPRRKPEKGRNL